MAVFMSSSQYQRQAEAQYQLRLSEAREAVNELVRHIHVSLNNLITYW